MPVSSIGTASPSAWMQLRPSASGEAAQTTPASGTTDGTGTAGSPDRAATPASSQRIAGGLTAEQLVELDKLKARDTEVRQHEAAHQRTGGAYTGAASFTFTRGPDGKRYATGGEVSVDTAPIQGKPEDTIAKMRTIQQAALAPAEPSSQDRRVAAQAAHALLQAQSELLLQQDKAQAQSARHHDDSHQHRLARAADAYQEAERASGII